MKINETGFWENETAEGHAHDEGLAKALVKFFNDQPRKRHSLNVIDIGCGDGYYLNYLNRSSEDEKIFCLGVDGNPNTKLMAGEKSFVWDLTQPMEFNVGHWVLCLEVGEHIPQELEAIFINNLHAHNRDGIVLSWAVRGQGGDGHVNCLDNIEVIRKIVPLGYEYDDKASAFLRSQCATYPKDGYWFRNTVMVFRKNK